jgi:hypothetical protein
MKPVSIESYNSKNILELNCSIDNSKKKEFKESSKREWIKPKIYLLSVSKTNADVFGDFSDGSLGYTNNS